MNPKLLIIVVCPACNFRDYQSTLGDIGVVPKAVNCDNCGALFTVTTEDVNEVQHECLKALGEA